jgi:TrmH family RNA methyltransferase
VAWRANARGFGGGNGADEPFPDAFAGARDRGAAPDGVQAGLTLALDGVQDPGNVGTILRIADWFAFDRVLLSPECADLHSQKVINASMGSFARVTAHVVRLEEALAHAAVPILACDSAGEDVHTLPALTDAVVVIGSEGQGLSPAMRARASKLVGIPRRGRAESLNAAVAAGIVCDALCLGRRP